MAFGVKTNERPGTRAELKFARFSAYKAREVLNLIRNKSVAEAQAILQLTERGAADHILRLLNSAIANAEHNDGIPADELYVSACFADEGPTLKRFRPRARGRAGRINKRTCHITVIVSRYSPDALEERRSRLSGRAAAPGAAASRARRVQSSRKSGDKPADATTAVNEVDDTDVVDAELVEADGTPQTLVAEAPNATTDGAQSDESTDDSPFGPGSAAPLEDGSAPEGFTIKGNADSMLYHPETSPFYGRTVAEVWFDSAESAEAAGFSLPPSMIDKSDDASDASEEGDN